MTTSAPTSRSVELLNLIEQHRDELEEVLRRHGAANVRIFGSVARGEAGEQSDIDLLFTRPEGMGLFTMARMGRELSDVLGVEVDVVPDATLYEHLRSDVLADAVPL